MESSFLVYWFWRSWRINNIILSAIIMGIFAFSGIKAITVLGYVAIPAIIFLSIATAIKREIPPAGKYLVIICRKSL